jgi:hypothetical protein
LSKEPAAAHHPRGGALLRLGRSPGCAMSPVWDEQDEPDKAARERLAA